MKPLQLTQRELAEHLNCEVKAINRLVNERSAVTVELALKLAATFQTTPDFWLNAQRALDLYRVSKTMKQLPRPLLRKKIVGTRAA